MAATPDQIHAVVLAKVKEKFEGYPVSEVRGYGPVTDGNGNKKKNCVVLLKDSTVSQPPNPIDAADPDGGGDLKITVFPQQAPSTFRSLFSGHDGITRRAAVGGTFAAIVGLRDIGAVLAADLAFTPPTPFPGPLMGGDAVYNDSNSINPSGIYWGTVGFIASNVTFKLIDGTQFNYSNVCISCEHVLRGAANVISTVTYPKSMTFKWAHPDIGVSGKWVDIAVADNTASAVADKLRGIGKIEGVSEPTLGAFLLKYGSTTGLTAGVDTGLVYRPFPDLASTALYMVRSISSNTGRFSDFGDSGSAIVDNTTRKLVGFVVGGTANGENYYIPTLGLAATSVDPNLSTVKIQLN